MVILMFLYIWGSYLISTQKAIGYRNRSSLCELQESIPYDNSCSVTVAIESRRSSIVSTLSNNMNLKLATNSTTAENEVLLEQHDQNQCDSECLTVTENLHVESTCESSCGQDLPNMIDNNTIKFVDVDFKPSVDCVVNVVPDDNNALSKGSDASMYFDTVSLSEPCCRVCQCNDTNEKLISPCYCSGSVKWIHESCLIQWMKSSLKNSCELCTKIIQIRKRRKPFSKWRLPSQRPTPVLWVLVFVTAIALNLASVVKDASRLCSSTPCLVFYAVGCIGVVLGTLFLIYWSKRARVFLYHWIELNEEWVVVVQPDDNKRTEHSVTNGNTKSAQCSITVDD